MNEIGTCSVWIIYRIDKFKILMVVDSENKAQMVLDNYKNMYGDENVVAEMYTLPYDDGGTERAVYISKNEKGIDIIVKEKELTYYDFTPNRRYVEYKIY